MTLYRNNFDVEVYIVYMRYDCIHVQNFKKLCCHTSPLNLEIFYCINLVIAIYMQAMLNYMMLMYKAGKIILFLTLERFN